jgi:hypothetical protein
MMDLLAPIAGYADEAVDASDAAHERLLDELDLVDGSVAHLFRAAQLRRLLEAAASVSAIETDQLIPTMLLPPRRRWLSVEAQGRLDGVAMGLRHVDSRVAIVRAGAAPAVVESETPMVLNAFSESRDPAGRETNAGSMRASHVAFLDIGAAFSPPPAERCRSLMRAMTDALAVRPAPAPPIVMAAWGALMVFAIHPFVDGNGRTARLLFQGVHSEGLTGGFDWGSLGEWALSRDEYIACIQQATNPAGSAIENIRPESFFDFALSRSVGGAQRALARLRHIADWHARWEPRFGAHAETLAFIAFERNVVDDEFAELGDRIAHVAAANELAAAGAIVRDIRGRWNLAPAVSG